MPKARSIVPESEITDEQKEAAEAEIRDKQKIVDYDTKEYPVEVLVQKYREGLDEDISEIYIPDYQREMIWDNVRQSKFIESIFLGLPIPYIFVADLRPEEEEDLGRMEIVDGTQRIRTLDRFLCDELKLSELKKLEKLNDFRFSNLPLARQRRFNRATIRMIVLTEKADEETRRDLFERVNSSIELNDMEKRRGTSPGPLVDLLEELAKEPKFVRLCPLSEVSRRKREPEEFILRFFAYLNNYKNFERKVNVFLNDYLERNNNAEIDKDAFRNTFHTMLDFVDKYFSPNGFSKAKGNVRTPRIRFEAISVGVALALRIKSDLKPKSIDWLDSEEFKEYTTSDASNSKPKVIRRIEYVRDQLLN